MKEASKTYKEELKFDLFLASDGPRTGHDMLMLFPRSLGVVQLKLTAGSFISRLNGTSSAKALALSPLFADSSILPTYQVVSAENDPPTFRQQTLDFVAALKNSHIQVELVDIANCDHFDVLDAL